MEKISKLIKILGYLDYALSAGVLAYGIYAQSWLYSAAGAVGLIIAYLKPADRLKGLIQRKFSRKLNGPEIVPGAPSSTPLSTSQTPSPLEPSFRPRRRYHEVEYFVGYEIDRPAPRLKAANASDYGAVLAVPLNRFRLGIKPTKIVPR